MNETTTPPKVVVITGPTASGKSAFGVELAQTFRGEIISADSVQIYRGFDIGSGKPTLREQAGVPHHLLSALEPTEEFNAGCFAELADRAITETVARGAVPIIVGGSGLYISALLAGLVSFEPGYQFRRAEVVRREEELREEDGGRSEEEIRATMYRWLREVDPDAADVLHRNDVTRVRHALAVGLRFTEPLSSLHRAHAREPRYQALVIALMPNRELLYQRINERVDSMLSSGLVDEVTRLLTQYSPQCKPFSSIGYTQVVKYLRGDLDFEAMREELKRETRRFAKRQYTWWRNQPRRLGWRERIEFSEDGVSECVSFVEEFLQTPHTDGRVDFSLIRDVDWKPINQGFIDGRIYAVS